MASTVAYCSCMKLFRIVISKMHEVPLASKGFRRVPESTLSKTIRHDCIKTRKCKACDGNGASMPKIVGSLKPLLSQQPAISWEKRFCVSGLSLVVSLNFFKSS